MNEELNLSKTLIEKMKNYTITPEEYRYLQYLLLKYESSYRKCYPVSKTKISDEKIMFISDTHIGGKDENKGLVYTAYNTALRKNIKTVIHGGDLTEALANNQFNKPVETVINEILTAICYMPEEVKTKVLLGNHDYSAIRTYSSIIPMYFDYPNLEIIGMKKVILNWNNTNISLNHHISQITCNYETDEDSLIDLYGHFHNFLIDKSKKTIKLPPLCNDTVDNITKELSKFYGLTFNRLSTPSFLIASKQDKNTILFEFYCINRPNYMVENDVERLEINTKTKVMKRYKEKNYSLT